MQPQPSPNSDSIANVGIIGAGFMGAQLALHFAACGYQVSVVDQSEESLTTMQRGHGEELNRRRSADQLSSDEATAVLQRIRATTHLAEAVAEADLVIEAVPERLDLKRSVFAELDRVCAPQTILATNSSSIRISQIENATRRTDRLLNTHFYPPIWQRPMVELMRGTARWTGSGGLPRRQD